MGYCSAIKMTNYSYIQHMTESHKQVDQKNPGTKHCVVHFYELQVIEIRIAVANRRVAVN